MYTVSPPAELGNLAPLWFIFLIACLIINGSFNNLVNSRPNHINHYGLNELIACRTTACTTLYHRVIFHLCTFSAALKSESFSLRSSPEWPWVLIIRQPNISGIYLTWLSGLTLGILPPDDPLTGFVCFQHSTLFSWFFLRPNRLLFATDFLPIIWYDIVQPANGQVYLSS